MRYHKAISISEVEAQFIIEHPAEASGDCIVVEHFGQWFDTRKMTEDEVDSFICDLVRATNCDIVAGRRTPH